MMTVRTRRAYWVVLIVASTMSAAILAWYALVQWASPIGLFPVPQSVADHRTYAPGESVHVFGVKCMNRSYPTEGRSSWVRQEPARLAVPKSVNGVMVRPAGCKTIDFENVIPDGLPAGVWRIEGVNTAYVGVWRQDVPWYTEPFTVTARGH